MQKKTSFSLSRKPAALLLAPLLSLLSPLLPVSRRRARLPSPAPPRISPEEPAGRLPKSSPDCAVCLSPFVPDAELRLLPACRHAFHAACVDAWLRNTPSCPICRAAISLPHPPLPAAYTAAAQQEPLDARSSSNASRSFRVEIGSVSNRRSSAVAAKSAVAGQRAAPQGPGEALAEAAGSRGWLREYVDRLASSASSLSGRWSARWSQSHHSHRQEDSWRWDPEAAAMAAPRAVDEDEAGLMGLYRQNACRHAGSRRSSASGTNGDRQTALSGKPESSAADRPGHGEPAGATGTTWTRRACGRGLDGVGAGGAAWAARTGWPPWEPAGVASACSGRRGVVVAGTARHGRGTGWPP